MDYGQIVDLVRSTKELILDETAVENITVKGVSDYVTQVDYNVQRYLKLQLDSRWPEVQFMSEEQKKNQIDFTRPVWILDPIDGTTNLMHHFFHSAVSLAYYDGTEVAFGAVFNPFTHELFHAERGKGCYFNEKKVTVSSPSSLEESLIIIGTSNYDKSLAPQNFAMFQRIFLRCQDIRRTGSAALDLAYVACGRCEGYAERHLKPWDYAAGMLLVKEAGGKTSTFSGGKVDIGKNCDMVASNGRIHNSLLELL